MTEDDIETIFTTLSDKRYEALMKTNLGAFGFHEHLQSFGCTCGREDCPRISFQSNLRHLFVENLTEMGQFFDAIEKKILETGAGKITNPEVADILLSMGRHPHQAEIEFNRTLKDRLAEVFGGNTRVTVVDLTDLLYRDGPLN